MGKDWITQVGIVLIALAAILLLEPSSAKDVALLSAGVLGGHLNGKGDSSPKPEKRT